MWVLNNVFLRVRLRVNLHAAGGATAWRPFNPVSLSAPIHSPDFCLNTDGLVVFRLFKPTGTTFPNLSAQC